MSTDKLGADNVLRRVYDPGTETLKVNAIATIEPGIVEISLSAADDSIAIGDGTNTLVVNPDGSINTNAVFTNTEIKITDGTDLLEINPDGSLNVVTTTPYLASTGSASANNVNLIGPSIDVSGYETINIQITGTFNANAQAQFSNNGVDWVAGLGINTGSATAAATTSINTTNALFKVPVVGRFFRFRTTAYTSGTIIANIFASAHDIIDLGQRSVSISGNVSAQAANAQVTGTGAALNATPINLTTVSQYDVMGLAITGTWVGSLVVEATNDGTNFFAIPSQQVNSLTALPKLSITSNGLYFIPLNFNQVRVRVASYTSGTVSANARISTFEGDILSPKRVVDSGEQRNVYSEVLNVAIGADVDVLSFTTTTQTRFISADVSGDNAAGYEILVNGTTVAKKRTSLGSPLETGFNFGPNGIAVPSGQTIKVRVNNYRPSVANFNSNIIIIEE